MKKIPLLFVRIFEERPDSYYTPGPKRSVMTSRINPKCEWVSRGEGVATVKWDGTAVMVRDNVRFFRRYDRKVTKGARRRGAPWYPADFKPAPPEWEACEGRPDMYTGHWPGWIPVGDSADEKHFQAAKRMVELGYFPDGTYELMGPKINGNHHGWRNWTMERHGYDQLPLCPRTFQSIREFLIKWPGFEGVVFHHPDGRMAKIRRVDYGLPWPEKERS